MSIAVQRGKRDERCSGHHKPGERCFRGGQGKGSAPRQTRKRQRQRQSGRERQRDDGLNTDDPPQQYQQPATHNPQPGRPEKNRVETRVMGRNQTGTGAARCQSVRSNRVDVCACAGWKEGRATYLIRFAVKGRREDEELQLQWDSKKEASTENALTFCS
jgi:hypothetical protein